MTDSDSEFENIGDSEESDDSYSEFEDPGTEQMLREEQPVSKESLKTSGNTIKPVEPNTADSETTKLPLARSSTKLPPTGKDTPAEITTDATQVRAPGDAPETSLSDNTSPPGKKYVMQMAQTTCIADTNWTYAKWLSSVNAALPGDDIPCWYWSKTKGHTILMCNAQYKTFIQRLLEADIVFNGDDAVVIEKGAIGAEEDEQPDDVGVPEASPGIEKEAVHSAAKKNLSRTRQKKNTPPNASDSLEHKSNLNEVTGTAGPKATQTEQGNQGGTKRRRRSRRKVTKDRPETEQDKDIDIDEDSGDSHTELTLSNKPVKSRTVKRRRLQEELAVEKPEKPEDQEATDPLDKPIGPEGAGFTVRHLTQNIRWPEWLIRHFHRIMIKDSWFGTEKETSRDKAMEHLLEVSAMDPESCTDTRIQEMWTNKLKVKVYNDGAKWKEKGWVHKVSTNQWKWVGGCDVPDYLAKFAASSSKATTTATTTTATAMTATAMTATAANAVCAKVPPQACDTLKKALRPFLVGGYYKELMQIVAEEIATKEVLNETSSARSGLNVISQQNIQSGLNVISQPSGTTKHIADSPSPTNDDETPPNHPPTNGDSRLNVINVTNQVHGEHNSFEGSVKITSTID